jgi:proline dehydrogenase
MRHIFLFLSKSRKIESFLLKLPFARRMAERFVAGEKREDALRVVRELNGRGILAALDHLGENVSRGEEAVRARDEYLSLLEEIKKNGVKSYVSLKLTQMGLDIDEGLCFENVKKIVEKAREYGNFVRIDMESSEYTERTLKIYKKLKREFNNIGIVIQAYLRRSEDDIRELIDMGANIRLCKGAYKEPPEIAFPKKKDVDGNFIHLMDMIFSNEAQKKGVYLAIATHDEKLIEWAKRETQLRGIGRDKFEFQMLYGIRRDLQEDLKREGYVMRVYVPYGDHWYPYFMRRLAERPANVLFLIKNILKD